MFATAVLETQQRVTRTAIGPARESRVIVNMGMIGFDIACVTVRSGSRMQGYLVNDLCKTISADKNSTAKRSAFALAA
jgi:hypothetical protein